jgi:branched-chain amino acid transport system permease protein
VSEFLEHLFNGIGSGAIYASLALALSLIYRTTGLLNFAQGEIALFTTYLTWQLTDSGLSIGLAVVVAAVAAFLLGAVLEAVVIRPFEQSPALVVVIVTIGLFLAFNSLALVMFGNEAKKMSRLFGEREPFNVLGGANLSVTTLGIVVLLAVECIVLYLILQRTKLGLALRAVASNPASARLSGISSSRMLMMGWAIAAVLGALAGVARVSDNTGNLDSTLMLQILVYAFAALAIGGFDSPVGAVVGGMIVGLTQGLWAGYVTSYADMPLLPPVALIMVVLLVRPTGLFGRRVVERV